MKKRTLLIVIAIILCLGAGAYYFLHNAQTFAQKDKKPEQNRALDLSKVQVDNPMVKNDGMVYCEIFVRSFYDSNGDGIGDLRGIAQKLDYIKELGANGIWLSPIFSTPSYHGYDVTDYYGINPELGTIEDFKYLISEAHNRGIKIILDFIPNHTSSQHPWFIDANKSKKSPYREYYVWADKDTNLKELNDNGNQVAWYTKGNGYYYSNFWSEMPELNFDSKKVRDEIENVSKFWIENGVDGFRIDAARHIFPQKRTQDTLLWWKEFGDYVRGIKKDVYLVGEIWSDEITISRYFKVLNSCFNFPVGEQIVKSAGSGNAADLVRIMDQTYNKYSQINKEFVDAPFLTNHDQDRVMSRLNSLEKMKSAAAIYLTLPGNPFIYYGEEIGMKGRKPDEQIREPFKWYDEKGQGQTTWESTQNNTGSYSPSVEEEEKDPNSLLNFYKEMIRFRLSNPVICKGDIKVLDAGNLVAYARTYNGETYLVIHNIKDMETSGKITLQEGIKLKGEILKGRGNIKVNNSDIDVKLAPNTFIIIR